LSTNCTGLFYKPDALPANTAKHGSKPCYFNNRLAKHNNGRQTFGKQTILEIDVWATGPNLNTTKLTVAQMVCHPNIHTK